MDCILDRKRASLLMEQQGIDLLLATGRANVSYLSGCSGGPNYGEFANDGERNHTFAALPKQLDQRTFFITHVVYKRRNWMDEHRYYGRSSHLDFAAPDIYHFLSDMKKDTTLYKTFADALSEQGLQPATIGVDLQHTPVDVFQNLKSALPKATFLDASELFWRLRMVKSREEIHRLKRSAAAGQKAMQAAFSVAREGMSFGDLWDTIQQSYAKENARHAFVHLGFGPGARQAGSEWEYDYVQSGCYLPDKTEVARNKLLLRNDIGRIDLGCAVDPPYACDLARAAVVGKATDQMNRVYAAMTESYYKISSAIRPGIEASRLFDIGYRPLADAGLQPSVVLLGHGIGTEIEERPFLVPTDHSVLEAGMVLTIEVVVHTKQLWSISIEDMVLVTENGHELLTPLGHVDGRPCMFVMP